MGRRLGIRWRQAQKMTNLCSVETPAGNLDKAESLGREALEITVELDHGLLLPYCVINLAGVASARGQHERAAYLLGAGDGLLAAAGMELNQARRSNTVDIEQRAPPRSARNSFAAATTPAGR
jgi:hypothetical protein